MAERAAIPEPYLTLADVNDPDTTWGLTVYAGHVTPMEKVGDQPWKPMAIIPGVLADFIGPFAEMFALWLTPRGLPSERNNPNPNVVDAIRRERFSRRQRQETAQPRPAKPEPEQGGTRYYSSKELVEIGRREGGHKALLDIGLSFGIDLRDGAPRKLEQGIREIMAAQRRHQDEASGLKRAPTVEEPEPEPEDDGWVDEPEKPQQSAPISVALSKETLDALNWNELRAVARQHGIDRKNRKQIIGDLLNKAAADLKASAQQRPDGHFGGTI